MRLSFEEVKRRQRERRTKRKQPEAAQAPVTQTPKRTASHKGGGYYDVHDSDGNVVAESVRKDEAQQLVEGET